MSRTNTSSTVWVVNWTAKKGGMSRLHINNNKYDGKLHIIALWGIRVRYQLTPTRLLLHSMIVIAISATRKKFQSIVQTQMEISSVLPPLVLFLVSDPETVRRYGRQGRILELLKGILLRNTYIELHATDHLRASSSPIYARLHERSDISQRHRKRSTLVLLL